MNQNDLEMLYEATSEDMLFAIGVVREAGFLIPRIHIFYHDWNRQQLELVRETFKGGLCLAKGELKQRIQNLYLSTKDRISLQSKDDGQTTILRAPAWDAWLSGVEEHVLCMFGDERRQHGGFTLEIQAMEWGFQCSVRDPVGGTIVGDVEQTHW